MCASGVWMGSFLALSFRVLDEFPRLSPVVSFGQAYGLLHLYPTVSALSLPCPPPSTRPPLGAPCSARVCFAFGPSGILLHY